MNLAGKTALVTGAGRGIGRGIALELARGGANLVLNDRPGSDALAATAAECEALGVSAKTIESDVFTFVGCESLVGEALMLTPAIDILVSNAARGLRKDFLEMAPEDFDDVLRATLSAGFYLSQLVARHLVGHQRPGKILFISSVQAEMPIARCAAYGAAKAGLNHLARSLAVELCPHRINVNAIEPGWTDTPGERLTFGDAMIETEGAKLPWQRLGTPEDIGKAARFLVSDDADYITGEVLCVDGGFRFKDCRAAAAIRPSDSPRPQ